jgi:hypothetical protein
METNRFLWSFERIFQSVLKIINSYLDLPEKSDKLQNGPDFGGPD